MNNALKDLLFRKEKCRERLPRRPRRVSGAQFVRIESSNMSKEGLTLFERRRNVWDGLLRPADFLASCSGTGNLERHLNVGYFHFKVPLYKATPCYNAMLLYESR